ncbi:hypothetical protein [Magnetospirillum moscoviense]|uniref:PEGA domain-containing protein n=1 Tax=Magnetospirillum moscoviense TaxID=1437059 RepID=A0A178MVM7_9PROT|nr:hypothetical protein [Magnetospirillum moscoviense]MBF0325770.1 hypothetical protein [Alphaproteobacteria bacterium]OAN54388.1 hypothetical protein A6A05_08465 [Magnetospirillum moscoviense]
MIGLWVKRGAVLAAIGLLGACASVVGSTESTVQIRTNPDKARCELKGMDGFEATIETPAAITIPNRASPVAVMCLAPGFRQTAHTLTASADGWIWGNSAFMVATGGIAVLGALVDESRGAGKAYAEEVDYTLTPDRPRPVKLRTRDAPGR